MVSRSGGRDRAIREGQRVGSEAGRNEPSLFAGRSQEQRSTHTMTRYCIQGRKKQHEIVIGWDRPLHTYFAQVWDKNDHSEDPILWAGVAFAELPSCQHLERLLKPYADIPQGNCIKPPLDYSGERLTSSRVLRTILRIWNIDPGGDGCRPKTLRNFLHRSLQALPIPGWSVPNGTPCWTSSSLPSAPPWATPTAGPTSNASARPNSTSFARSWTCPTVSPRMTPSAASSLVSIRPN